MRSYERSSFESESLLGKTGKFIARETKILSKSVLVSGIETAALYLILKHIAPGLLPDNPADLMGALAGIEFVRQSSARPYEKDGL